MGPVVTSRRLVLLSLSWLFVFFEREVEVLRMCTHLEVRAEELLLEVRVEVLCVSHGLVDAVLNDSCVADEVVDVEVDVLDHVARGMGEFVVVAGASGDGQATGKLMGVPEVIDLESVGKLHSRRKLCTETCRLREKVSVAFRAEIVDDVYIVLFLRDIVRGGLSAAERGAGALEGEGVGVLPGLANNDVLSGLQARVFELVGEQLVLQLVRDAVQLAHVSLVLLLYVFFVGHEGLVEVEEDGVFEQLDVTRGLHVE
mmetsp:Transcript_7752/g.6768  ORF Transcript_7752/g.6768 Transcript_7752/m.6768 type:complete len:257 (+) Transcript_7752:613-1383(+)